MSEPEEPHCHGAMDGDCDWSECPQKVHYQSYCPYAKAWEAYWDANGDDYR